ncbi:MAG TPA: MFS transporter [Bacilli bacterium]|nr:MFS transporter [Bacilli bacterium]
MEQKQTLRKIAFASADIFGGGSFNIINFLYPFFLAVTVGVKPGWIAAIMLIARLWDAITDPIMGNLSDRTKSRFGKRRIYLIFASPFVLVSMYFLFFPYNISGDAAKIITVLLSYLVFTTVQTSIMIPYYSLSSEISRDYQKRASYNSYRLGFSIFSSILCVALPKIIVNLKIWTPEIGYQVMSLSFGLLFAISVLMTGLFAKEEIKTEPVYTKFNIKEMTKPLKLRPFRQYLVMFMVLQMTMAIMSGLFFFYVDYHVVASVTDSGDTSFVGMLAAALMFSMQIVALPAYIKIIEKKGKAFAYRLGSFVWIVCGALLFLIPQNSNPIYVYVLAIIIGLGISGPGLVPHTMYGDVVDVGEVKFKTRLDGQMSGFTNFLSKVAQAIGISSVMFILELAKFQERVPGEPPPPNQPDSAMLAIRLILMIAPIILMGIGIFVSYKYKIDYAKQLEIQKYLKEKHISEEQLMESL